MAEIEVRRYRTTPDTITALNASIAHWRNNICLLVNRDEWKNYKNAIAWLRIHAKSNSCPLCRLYRARCRYCILYVADEFLECDNSNYESPWQRVQQACLAANRAAAIEAATELECILWAVIEGAEK